MSHRVRELIVTYRANPTIPPMGNRTLTTPANAAALFVPMLENQAQEVFVIALLNAKGRLLCTHEIGRGGLRSTIAEPRMIVRAALLVDAAAVLLAHNHPSGDPQPSPDDIALTRKVIAACELFDIAVHDHLIIGEGRFISLKEYGIL